MLEHVEDCGSASVVSALNQRAETFRTVKSTAVSKRIVILTRKQNSKMFLGLTQRHILVREDDFCQSQIAETYCDPLKNKNEYYQLMCSYNEHIVAKMWPFYFYQNYLLR